MIDRCILLAAGGTGGHLFPAASLAAALSARGIPVELATDDRALRYGADFPARKIHAIPSATPTGAGFVTKVRAAAMLGYGTLAARRLLKALQPRAVVGFGGYPTVPPLTAAAWLKIPTLLHEQNAVMGRANRFLSGRVNVIATGFPDLKGVGADAKTKLRFVGNPVRPSVLEAAKIPFPDASDGKLRLLVTGGSQGARVMAEVIPAALEKLGPAARARIVLVQQARGEDEARVTAAYAALNFPAEIAPFFTDLPRRIAQAHCVIGRAGASTVSELAVIGRPSLLVPFPFALDQDQAANAAYLAAAGGAWVVRQTEFTAEMLAAFLSDALSDPGKLADAAAKARREGVADAAERLADVVMELARRG